MYKTILSSTLPLLVTILLFVVLGNYGVGRVLSLRSQISQAQADKATLTEKLSTLQTVSATVGTGSQLAAAALPGKNTALIVLSQLKGVATQNAVTLTNLKSSAETKDVSGLSRVDVSFDVNGSKSDIIAFLDGIEKTAPIARVDKIKVSESAGETRAAVTVKSFWADFPKSLPSIAQAITGLTTDEQSTLTKISSLTQPQFVEVPPSSGGGKTDPFSP